jgi:hypothetical protein
MHRELYLELKKRFSLRTQTTVRQNRVINTTVYIQGKKALLRKSKNLPSNYTSLIMLYFVCCCCEGGGNYRGLNTLKLLDITSKLYITH